MTLAVTLDVEMAEGKSFDSVAVGKKLMMWKILNACAFVLNIGIVAIPGRLDNDPNRPFNLAEPALYAFFMWAAIYFSEAVFVVWQATVRASSAPIRRINMIMALSPGFVAGNLCQCIWAATFRPYMDTFALLWISAFWLCAIAACLNFAHRELKVAEGIENFFAVVPISLHFGWTTAAGLVNWNGWLARGEAAAGIRLAFLIFCIVVAMGIGTYITVTRNAALYGGTIAWAVIAVGVMTLTDQAEEWAADQGSTWQTFMGWTSIVVGASLIAVGIRTKIVNNKVQG